MFALVVLCADAISTVA